MLSDRSHIICGLICLVFSVNVWTQNYITNPGFEGPDGVEVIPEDWFAGCGVMNTPDTQPGWWNIENKPHEGKSYINLLFKEDGTTESVYQKLAEPLLPDACYLIEIYLAQACQDSLSGLYPYNLNHPGDLVIRGSTSYGCSNGQILAKFEQVSNCKWRPYYSVFQADSVINYVYLEFEKGASVFLNGSVLIDQFKLEDLHPFPDEILEISFETSVTLQAKTEGSDHVWKLGDSIVAVNTAVYDLSVESNSEIYLTYMADDGCLVQEHFLIYVKPDIPNIITPNDPDQINDVFYIHGLNEMSALYIVNRWGELIFQQSPYENTWSPQNLSSGTYFYRLDLLDSDRIFQGAFYIP